MKVRSESPAATHLIERQMLLSRVREQATHRREITNPETPYRFITIARDVGSMGDTVAAGLAQHLGWHVFDKEIVDFIAQDNHVREDLVRELDERSQSLIHDMVQRLLLMAEGISFGNEEYHEALLRTLAYLAARGHAIIIGRGGAYALQGGPGLHVRVIASAEKRVSRLAARWKVSPEEARRRMHEVDVQRRGYIQHHFRQNLDLPYFYDLICNTDHMTTEQAIHAVLGLMTVPRTEFRTVEVADVQTVPAGVPGVASLQEHPAIRSAGSGEPPLQF